MRLTAHSRVDCDLTSLPIVLGLRWLKMTVNEITSSKPLTLDQAKINSLKKQKYAAAQRFKAERDKQKRLKAVHQLASMSATAKTA